MSDTTEPRRFRTAAAFYIAGRTPYPERLVRNIARFCRVTPGHRVLDLGCGPGQLAIAFASRAGEVVAADPEPEMIAIARMRAEAAGVDNILFRTEGSATLSPAWGAFRIVTMGRSFHWMERVETLRRLESLVDPRGAVVLFSDEHLKVPENGWVASFREIIERYSSDDPGRSPHRRPDWLIHEGVLLASAFSRLDRLSVIKRRRMNAETIITRALSLSSTSPSRLGERTEMLIAELKEFLERAAPEGYLHEVVESRALVARRPHKN